MRVSMQSISSACSASGLMIVREKGTGNLNRRARSEMIQGDDERGAVVRTRPAK
jgi:hypothetical protein